VGLAVQSLREDDVILSGAVGPFRGGGAGFREVEIGAVSVVLETETPVQFTEFIRDVAPRFTALVRIGD
jgi:hypothetical protein